MAVSNILIIEDEKDIVEALEYNLRKEGFRTSRAYDGKSGLKAALEKPFDLVILDLMLPAVDGLEVCRRLKSSQKASAIPIIMLTAKGSETDRVLGLELGADDYITKPFSMRELIARVKAVLKRSARPQEGAGPALRFPGLEIDIEKHEVLASGKPVELTAREFALLRYLAENRDKALTREKLLDRVWGIDVAIETRTVDVHVKSLRDKLKKASRYIQTLRGVGYKFKA